MEHKDNNDTCLSKSELIGLSDGSLDQVVKQRVDAHLAGCELCSNAVEGYSATPSMAMLGVLDNDINEMIETKIGVSSSFNFQQALNVVLTLVIVGGGIYFFSQNGEKELVPEVVAIVDERPAVERKIEKANTLTGNASLKNDDASRWTTASTEVPEEAEVNWESGEERERTPVSYMPLQHIDANALDQIKGEKKQRAVISTNTKYIYDMKTYDYESIYKREHEYTWYNPNLGVPAEYAHSTDVITYENGPDHKTIWTSYESILNTALAEYKRGKYAKSLTSLNLLLDDYPSDINGLFYKGLCLYHMQKYKKSISYMTSTTADVNPTFDQEAEWFIALGNLKLGEQEIAIEQFKSIVTYNGFYKKEAKKKLREIE